MKKLFAVLLALTMLSVIMSASAEPALADIDPENVTIPSLGDVVEGFEAKEIRRFDMIGADLVLFEHQATGARLFYIANNDINRAFQLTFPTRPVDNTGLPHVFEHSTLSGSRKYPGTSLFMNVSYQTYNTYMNAYTTDAMTSYPVASLSEKQLLALADMYTDCCLHPLIMEREDIFRTEAWRYELTDMEGPLTLNGTVYSEMTGALTLQRSAMDNANELTFPGSTLSYNYGGKPESIPDMTWEALRNYHDTYYHPSNCMAYLYGFFEDYTVFLKLLNEAFSGYEKKDFSFTDTGYTRITEPVTASVPYAVAEGTDTADQSSIYYYIICPGLKEDKAVQRAVDHVCTLLNTDGSLLMQNLKKAFPSGGFSFGREVAAPDDAVVFIADNVNKDDAETFRTIINDTLKQLAQDGFDQVQLEAILAALQLHNKLALENGSAVESIIYSFAYDYAVTGDPFEYAEQMKDYGDIRTEHDSGMLASAISEWLVDPALYTLTVTYPEPGLKEQQDAALEADLAAVKAGMSDAEKQTVIDATLSEPVKEDNTELIASLKVLDVADLPEEIREYRITDETGEDGVRRLNAEAGVDGVGMVSLYLDARSLPQEDIHYLRLFTRLLGDLDTEYHTKEELAVQLDRYLQDRTIGVDTFDTAEKDDVRALLVAEWTALDEDLDEGYSLVTELLFHTQFTDHQTLSERITAQKSRVRNTISANPYIALYTRQEGFSDPWARYYDYLNFTSYYAFLEDLEQQMTENPESVADRLRNIQLFLYNRAGATAAFAGNETSMAVNAPLADSFFADMPSESRDYPVYNLPEPLMREAISVDDNIQYNCIAASFRQLGTEPDYAFNVIGPLVVDQLLMPVLRDQMGAYSVFCGMDKDMGLYLISYRDPNVKATFDVYDAIPEQLAALELTQDQVNGYIISAYPELAKPEGELSGAVTAIERILHERPADEVLQQMRAYKSVTPESVKASADAFALLTKKGPRGTVGSIANLQSNRDLYDTIINPFHTEAVELSSMTDVSEDNEFFEAIMKVYESGIMAAKEEGVFAPGDPATVGDLLGPVNILLGGPNDAEAARETLSAYGLVKADQSLDAEIHEDFLCSLINALYDQEILTTDTPDAVVSRGDLADLLSQMF